MSIFKAYDIRGIVPDQLDEKMAYGIGRAFVTFLGCPSVVVGRDVRSTSDSIFAALASGITDQGADVIEIGRCDTPMLYFAARDSHAAINITASHNPKEYNGFKLCRENAIPISGDTGIKDIERLYIEGKFAEPAKKGKIIKRDALTDFIKFTRSFIKFEGVGKRLKVVIDCANGSGGLTYPHIFGNLALDFVPLYMEPDGTFPNHEANPLIEANLVDLKKKVLETGADLGASIDGDADRCMFIDERGETIRADIAGAIIARDLLKTHKGAAVLYDLRSTKAAAEDIEEYGGRPVQCRVGHAFIKQQMRENDAIFAAELSGHFYFKEHNFTESSAIALISILNLLAETGKKMSELAAPVMRYSHSGEINFEVENKDAILKTLEETYGSKGNMYHLDGLSVDFGDWWFNVRASNTEPLLRLNLETPNPQMLEEKKAELVKILSGK
ncbi:MAG: phosphomannomutase/phosphoglucomutase [bacterium]